MAKGKVKSAVFKKSGTGQYGEYHIFDITIEGDDKVYQFMGKTNPQTKFIVGQEAEYTTDTKQVGNYTNHSIKPVQQQGNFAGGNPQRLELDKKIAALRCTIELIKADKIKFEQLRPTFEKLLKEYL